jgi:hypothetical protein
VLYRMRIYQAVRENLPVFHEFFRTYLLPVQLRHVPGWWVDGKPRTAALAIWEYNDAAAHEQIQAAVRADPDSDCAQNYRAHLPPLITDTEDVFMSSTIHAGS